MAGGETGQGMKMSTQPIWVSAELAKEFEQLKSVEEQEASVKRVIERKRLDLDAENEMLGESLLQFKSVCLAHKKELEKVYQEQADKIYALWEDMGDVSSMVSRHAKALSAEIKPITLEVQAAKRSVDELKKSVLDLNVYGAERVVELAKMVSQMDDKSKEILSALLAKK